MISTGPTLVPEPPVIRSTAFTKAGQAATSGATELGREAVRERSLPWATASAIRCEREGVDMEQREPAFEAMNETDVREEVIAPLIRKLGYQTGSEHNVIRELGLTYNQAQLGRQKKSDPPLRGKADYLLEAGGRVRWVIEAKAPSAPLDAAVEAQAWTYANHPEVRAVYFMVTNGRLFRLYRTINGPDMPPVLEFSYDEISSRMLAITNTLSPNGMLRDFPDVKIDEGEPLGLGLRSAVRIASGRMNVDLIEPKVAPVEMLTTSIVGGSACRRPGGGITVTYQSEVAVTPIQAFNEQIGLNRIELVSADDVLSDNPSRPSVFRAEHRFFVPKGTASLDINTWQMGEAVADFTVDINLEASGHLEGQEFSGRFHSNMRMSFDLPDKGPHVIVMATGKFRLTLV